MLSRIVWLSMLLLTVLCSSAASAEPLRIPLTADRWRIAPEQDATDKADAQFTAHEGFPQGVLVLKSGVARLNGFSFRGGTIEFDLKALAADIPGIQFRMEGLPGHENGEEFYVRTFPDCRASNDCIQYAPVINGFLLWNVYPQYQTQAPVLDGWNHVRLIISGRRMNVFLNGATTPVLAVGALESPSEAGALQLRGPAMFANLTIAGGAVEKLSPVPTIDPTAGDPGFVRQWQLGPQTPSHRGKDPTCAEMPPESAAWKPITAGRYGLVNLNRAFPRSPQPPAMTWLRTTVFASTGREANVSLGWLGHVWIFVNGRLITQGKNFYDPEYERRPPDGRLSLENGAFSIPLQQGENSLVLALTGGVHDDDHTPNRYGWGTMLHFRDAKGLRFPATPRGEPDSVKRHLSPEQ